METPASIYAPSPRRHPSRQPVPEYPGHFTVERITTGGTFRFGNRVRYLANALKGGLLGLDEIDDGIWHIRTAWPYGAGEIAPRALDPAQAKGRSRCAFHARDVDARRS